MSQVPTSPREIGPDRNMRRYREHPRADAELPRVQQAFEVDIGFGLKEPGQAQSLKKNHGRYTTASTQRAYETYQLGWQAHKRHMDRCMDIVLSRTEDPEEREMVQRAFTRLRMAL